MNKTSARYFAERILKISIALVIVWYLFKLMHWPFSDSLLLISHLSLSISYLILFTVRKDKGVIDYGSALVAVLILINLLYPIITGNPSPFRIYGNLLLLFIILPEGYNAFATNRKTMDSPTPELENYEFGAEDNPEEAIPVSYDTKPKTKISSVLLGIGVLPVLLGVMFKMMHWPYTSILLVTGFGLSAIGVFLLFIKK